MERALPGQFTRAGSFALIFTLTVADAFSCGRRVKLHWLRACMDSFLPIRTACYFLTVSPAMTGLFSRLAVLTDAW